MAAIRANTLEQDLRARTSGQTGSAEPCSRDHPWSALARTDRTTRDGSPTRAAQTFCLCAAPPPPKLSSLCLLLLPWADAAARCWGISVRGRRPAESGKKQASRTSSWVFLLLPSLLLLLCCEQLREQPLGTTSDLNDPGPSQLASRLSLPRPCCPCRRRRRRFVASLLFAFSLPATSKSALF